MNNPVAGCARFLVLAAWLLVGMPRAAWPCSCVPSPPPAVAFEGADTVFLGRVLAVRSGETWFGHLEMFARSVWSNGRDPYIRKWEESPRALKAAELEVLESYKGGSTETATVYTRMAEAECGAGFQQGGRFLVYGYITDDPLTPGSHFVATSLCSRTAHREHDNNEIRELRQRSSASRVTGPSNQPLEPSRGSSTPSPARAGAPH